MPQPPSEGCFASRPGPIGTRFHTIRDFEVLDSTNTYLVEEACKGAPEGLVALAAEQSAGRGRLGRAWASPPGENLLVSVLLRPRLSVDELHLCTVAVALAARYATKMATGVEPGLKWPNDLVVEDRKLAGILAESIIVASESPPGIEPASAAAEPARAVVVGIGMNLNWPRTREEALAVEVELGRGLEGGARRPITSLLVESGVHVDAASFLEVFLGDLDWRVGDLDSSAGRRRQAGEYRSVCVTLGRRVRVDTGSGLGGSPIEGEAVDITAEGHLVVQGEVCMSTVSAGDVYHLS